MRDRLYNLYPLPTDKLQEIVAGACFAATLNGYITARENQKTKFAEPGDINLSWSTPFGLAVQYANQKGYKISPNSWRDMWKDDHAHAFTVARVTSMDVLRDVRGMVDASLDAGMTLKKFSKSLIPRLEAAGWWANKGEPVVVTMPDGSERKRLTANRLAIIYDTNINVANSVGRWKQIKEHQDTRPYVRYDGVDDPSTRPSHAALHGKIFRLDDPGLTPIVPPNGFRCRCYLTSLSASQVKDKLISDASAYHSAADEGWDYNPGEAAMSTWKPDLSKYDPALVAKAKDNFKPMAAQAAGEVEALPQAPQSRQKFKIEMVEKTDVGVTIHKQEGMNIATEFIDKLKLNLGEIHNKIPEKYQGLLKDVYVMNQENPMDAKWRVEYNYPDFLSAATAGKDRMFFWAPEYWAGVKPTLLRGIQRVTMEHEIGHLIGNSIGSGFPAEWAEFTVVEGWSSPYSKKAQDLAENFAESVKFCFEEIERFKTAFPRKHQFLTSLLRKTAAE